MRPGVVVANRFEIERLGGTGGMGRVYCAKDLRDGGRVALKVVQQTRDAERFEHEAEVLARLSHPGIVRYVGHGASASGEQWLAMEWLEGEDLGARLARSRLSLEDCIEVGRRAADALGAAHALGVVHRDVKPSNVFLVDGAPTRVKLLDFGVARGMETRPSTKTGVTLGTPGYMAPEQARGERDLDARADVFALGCVLFECATGRPAFVGQHALALLAKILLEESPRIGDLVKAPRALDDLVARMLAKDPRARPKDGGEVSRELDAIACEAPVSIEEAPPTLTRAEQRLVAVVLVKSFAAMPPARGATLVGAGRRARDATLASAIAPESAGDATTAPAAAFDSAAGASLRDAAARFGGRLEPLADGSVAVLLAGGRDATDQAAQAARCALALKAAAPSCPVALATGRAVLGQSHRGKLALATSIEIGEAIERVSRLVHAEARRSSAQGDLAVRIDDVTRGLLGARFEVASEQRIESGDRGEKAENRLLREREAGEDGATSIGADALAPSSTPRSRPFVGRERELGLLDGIFAEAVDEGGGRAVLVTAAAGVGKSRLVAEFVARLRARGAPLEVWTGSGNPVSMGSPFGVLAPALRRAAGIAGGETSSARRAKLLARVERHVAPREALRVAEFLGEVAGVPFPDEGRTELRAARQNPMILGDQMRRAFEDLLAAECAAQPVVLVLEDLHWGDYPSVSFVDSALRNLDGSPLLVVAVARPEVKDQFPKLFQERGLEVLHLAGLTRRSAERFVRGALGDDASAARVEEIVERAGGNAFYLEELVRAVAEGSETALPETVLAMVEARLGALSSEARLALRAASVFGQVFWRGGVRALVGADASSREIDAALGELEQRELVRAGVGEKFSGEGAAAEREYVFRHALVREAAYDMLTDADRPLGHRLAAEWLAGVGETDARVLADHFARGGARDRAAIFYGKAAEHALAANDFRGALEAVRSAERSGAVGEARGALALVEAEARTWLGEHDHALVAARSALELLPRGSAAWCMAAGEAAIAAGRVSDPDTTEAVARALVDLETRSANEDGLRGAAYDRAARVVAGSRASMQLFVAGRYELASALCASIEREEAAIASDPIARARLDQARAFRAHALGDTGAYLDALVAAAAGFAQAGDRRNACVQRGNVGHALLELGAHEASRDALIEARATAERLGLPYIAAVAKHNLGLALGFLGRFEEAVASEGEAMRDFDALGDQRLSAASRVYLAQILLAKGDAPAAARELDRIDDAAAGEPLEALASATRSRVELARGEVDRALLAASRAHGILERLGGVDEGESVVRLAYAEALLASGQSELAREVLSKAKVRLTERAARIGDSALRASMLTRVPENARLLTLAEAILAR